MVLDGLRGYLQLASGLTDVTRERARAAARSLVAQGEAVVPDGVRAQVSALTDDLLATSRANRDLLVHLVRGEVERSVARLGLVSAQDLAAATRRVERLERRVTDLEAQVVGPAPTRRTPTSRTTSRTSSTKASAKAPTKAPAKAAKRTAAARKAQPSPVRPPGSGPAVPPGTPPASGTGA